MVDTTGTHAGEGAGGPPLPTDQRKQIQSDPIFNARSDCRARPPVRRRGRKPLETVSQPRIPVSAGRYAHRKATIHAMPLAQLVSCLVAPNEYPMGISMQFRWLPTGSSEGNTRKPLETLVIRDPTARARACARKKASRNAMPLAQKKHDTPMTPLVTPCHSPSMRHCSAIRPPRDSTERALEAAPRRSLSALF